ncbi:MAG: hypothetical protein ACK501_02945 [Planctomycetota bacterium]|jgi:hypothetical protein
MRKSIPCGLLAFAVSASLLVAQEPGKTPGGWSAKAGSGLTYDGGDSFGINWLSFAQASWSYANNENAAAPLSGDDTNSFDVGVARTQLRGHVYNRNITYRLQLDLAENGDQNGSILKDAYAQYNFSSSDEGRVGLRFGQGKTLFGLEGTGWVHGLWFVDRSNASEAFAGARSRGAWLVGSLMEKDRPVRFALGAMNGDVSGALAAGDPNTTPITPGFVGVGEENRNGSNELSYVASANWDLLGDFFGGEQTAEYWRQGDMRTDGPCRGTIGAGIALGNGVEAATSPRDIESTSINLNTAWNCKAWSFLGEWFTRRDDIQSGVSDEEDVSGWAASLGYLLPKNGDSSMQWGLGLRVGMVETDEGTPGSDVDFLTGMRGIGAVVGEATEVSAVVNAFYNGDHSCKTQLQYTWQDVDPSAPGSGQTNHILSVLFQFTF